MSVKNDNDDAGAETFAPPKAPLSMPRQNLQSPALGEVVTGFLSLAPFLTRREQ